MTEHQQAILEGCKRGERHAQRQLYELFKDKLFVICLRYADNRQDAEDLLQEGFVKIFRDLGQYRGAGNFEGWLRKVVLRVALQYVRQQKKAFQITELDGLEYKLQDESTNLEENEIAKMLVKLMHRMPTGFRTVLNLYVMEGFTHIQIAEELGISVGTSKSQLNRAKAYLKSLLEKTLTG